MAFEVGRSNLNENVNGKMAKMAAPTREECALIVDDDVVIRMTTSRLLNHFGFKVSTVNDGVKVVSMYEGGEGHFNLIIMDLEMPIMNGIEATRELRTRGVECMIIGVTACNDESQKQSFKEAGLDHLFEKPLSIAKLQNCLQNN